MKCEISLNKSLFFFISQEKMLDMESDLEELHDSEQRWAAKHKRAIEQVLLRLLPPLSLLYEVEHLHGLALWYFFSPFYC